MLAKERGRESKNSRWNEPLNWRSSNLPSRNGNGWRKSWRRRGRTPTVRLRRGPRMRGARPNGRRPHGKRQICKRRHGRKPRGSRLQRTRPQKSRPQRSRPQKSKPQKSKPQKSKPQRVEAAKVEAAKVEAAKVEAAKVEAAQGRGREGRSRKVEAAKAEAAKAEAARAEAARAEAAAKPHRSREAARTKPQDRCASGGRRLEAARRAIGRQLDEEAARRDAAPRLSPSSSGAVDTASSVALIPTRSSSCTRKPGPGRSS